MTIAVIAATRFYRDGLARLFAQRKGFALVGSISASAMAPLTIGQFDPDIVLLAAEGQAAIALVRELVDAAPRSRVVMLGIADDDARIVELAEAGVAGYVGIDASAAELVSVVGSVARGETPCSPRIAAVLLRRVAVLARTQASARAIEVPRPLLTRREREIFTLVARGLSNKEIARILCIELSTVKNHVHNVLEKLRVSRRDDAVALLRGRSELSPLPISDPLQPPRSQVGI